MLNIQLYIQGNEIELDKTVNFPLTKQYEDLNDPTTIINDWSRTIEIPGTVKNNNIFGSIFRPDRLITNANGVGINFDPTQKLDMKLIYNGNLLLLGYAKVNSVVNKNGNIKYNITLNGQLGKLFQEMQKITFDEKADEKYYIDTHLFVNERMNKDLIYNAWNSNGQQHIDLVDAVMNGDINDFIGFTPNVARMEGFDYSSGQFTDMSAEKFAEILDKTDNFKTAGMSGSTALPNGMSPRGIGEFRSYHQLPYLYVNKLFQIFQEKAEELTGYRWEYDDYWFNAKNPYWKDLVMLMEPLSGDSGFNYVNKYSMQAADITGGISRDRFWWYKTSNRTSSGEYAFYPALTTNMSGYYLPDVSKSTEVIPMYDATTKTFTIPAGYSFTVFPAFKLTIEHGNASLAGTGCIYKNYGLEFKFTYGETAIKTLIVGPLTEVPTTGYDQIITIPYFTPKLIEGTGGGKQIFDIPLELPTIEMATETQIRYTISARWICVNGAASNISPIRTPWGDQMCTDHLEVYLKPREEATALAATDGGQRSHSKINISKFWNEQVSLFDEILRYCKIFGILIQTDDINRVLKFVHRAKYFREYSIVDWTDKVDFTKDYTITPVVNDCKYMLFNYNDTEINGNNIYKDEFGYNYGEYRVETHYNFDNNVNKIMPDANPSLTHTPNVLSWNNISNGNIVYSVPAEYYVDCKGQDEKYVSSFGAYFFTSSYNNFDNTKALGLRKVRITDDSPYQIVNNTYMYNLSNMSYVETNFYTSLRIDNDNYENTYFTAQPMCSYAVPSRGFDYKRPFDENAKGIYDIIWKEWLNERQNIQNKKLTCYVDLSPTDYLQFEFNHFIKIDDVLYFVNKIYDYDVTTNNLTKVDLLLVSNIKAYLTIPYYDVTKQLTPNTPNITFNRGDLGNIQVELPGIVKQDGIITGLMENGNTTNSVTLENGANLSVVDNKILLKFNSDENGTPVSTTSTDRLYVMQVSSASNAPGRNPVDEEINWDELDSIVSESGLTASLINNILDGTDIADVTPNDETEGLIDEILS